MLLTKGELYKGKDRTGGTSSLRCKENDEIRVKVNTVAMYIANIF